MKKADIAQIATLSGRKSLNGVKANKTEENKVRRIEDSSKTNNNINSLNIFRQREFQNYINRR